MKNFFKVFFAFLAITILYFLFSPVNFEPVAYSPPPDPGLKGVFEKNNQLTKSRKILNGEGIGPESIVFGPDSMFYTGYANGRIIKFSPDGKTVSNFAKTKRPLGMKFDAFNNLIVADEFQGLLSINPQGETQVLTNEVDDTPIFFADDLDIAEDGMIYFTDASQRNHDIEREIWELQPTGRLLSYNPTTKVTKVVFEGMRFANGVALGPDDEYLLVNETFGMIINKLWLKGTRTGQKEIFVNELPGYPDNITFNDNGLFWVAMPGNRVGPQFEDFYEKPFWRKVIKRLPESITGARAPAPMGIIVGFDTSGKVVHNLQDTTGGFHDLTSAIEVDGQLYIGNLKMDAVGVYSIMD